MSESLDRLEALNLVSADDDEDGSLTRGSDVDNDEQSESMGGVEGHGDIIAKSGLLRQQPMQNRGMQYFEDMVENSRLGRIKREKGGHTSQDGKTTIQWEVLEIESDGSGPIDAVGDDGGSSNKRQKLNE